MLQDIAPHRIDMAYGRREPADSDFVIVVRGNKILLRDGGGEGEGMLPRVTDLEAAVPGIRGSLDFLFSVDADGVHLFASAPEGIPGCVFRDTLVLRMFQPSWLGFAAITACHLGNWYAANRFCGGCGAKTARKEDERALICPDCGSVVYPRISPAIIAAVTDGDRILLTRYANRPNNNALTALVAGFMEVGETLEETVAREVEEEVGLRVRNIRYYKSQPWAFSGSVLVGFFADVDGSTEITVDKNELQEAAWIARGDLPEDMNTASLTATMIDAFRRNAYPASCIQETTREAAAPRSRR